MPTTYTGHHSGGGGASNVPSGTGSGSGSGTGTSSPINYEFTQQECMDANYMLQFLSNDQESFNQVLALDQKSGQLDKFGMCAGLGGCGSGSRAIWVDLGNLYARLRWKPAIKKVGDETQINCSQATLQVDYYDKNKKPISQAEAGLKKLESQWIWIAVAVILFIIIIKKIRK